MYLGIRRRTLLATATIVAMAFFSAAAVASPIYLNHENMTVALGSSHDDAVASNPTFGPFQNVNIDNSLANIIDAPSADAGEFHNQSTHVWSEAPLELVFDLLTDYDILSLHFWNYHSFGWEVGGISLTFFDVNNTFVGDYLASPHLGGRPDASDNDATEIFAQNFDLSGASFTDVRFINAVLFGGPTRPTQVDFQNIGFTGLLSGEDLITPPPPPPVSVNEPATVLLLLAGLLGLVFTRRRLEFRTVASTN